MNQLTNFFEASEGRDYVGTNDFAKALGKAPQTLRKLSCIQGHAYGVRPHKVGNTLLWPVPAIADLLLGGTE